MIRAQDWFTAMIMLGLLALIMGARYNPEVMYVPPSKPTGLRTVTVEKVYDGDTFRTTAGEFVRLEGIDAPGTEYERLPAADYGDDSADLLRSLLEGATIELETGPNRTDRYGRTLAWVWIGELLVNVALVRAGLAVTRSGPPNVKYLRQVREAEEYAQEARKNLWNQ